jgi:hypothetical protein
VILQSTLTGDPFDVLDEFGFQPGGVGLVLRLCMNKDDGCVLHLHFTPAIAARSVEQRLFKRAKSELLGEEH